MLEYLGKTVYIRSSVGRIYSGVVKSVDFLGYGPKNEVFYMLTLIDKYKRLVSISSNQIMFIEERGEDDGRGDK